MMSYCDGVCVIWLLNLINCVFNICLEIWNMLLDLEKRPKAKYEQQNKHICIVCICNLNWDIYFSCIKENHLTLICLLSCSFCAVWWFLKMKRHFFKLNNTDSNSREMLFYLKIIQYLLFYLRKWEVYKFFESF